MEKADANVEVLLVPSGFGGSFRCDNDILCRQLTAPFGDWFPMTITRKAEPKYDGHDSSNEAMVLTASTGMLRTEILAEIKSAVIAAELKTRDETNTFRAGIHTAVRELGASMDGHNRSSDKRFEAIEGGLTGVQGELAEVKVQLKNIDDGQLEILKRLPLIEGSVVTLTADTKDGVSFTRRIKPWTSVAHDINELRRTKTGRWLLGGLGVYFSSRLVAWVGGVQLQTWMLHMIVKDLHIGK